MIYLGLGVIILLLVAILNVVRNGFNEVVKGLQAIHDSQRRGPGARDL